MKKHAVESDKVSDSVTSGEQEDSDAEESESAEDEEEEESREDEVASDVEWEEGKAAGVDEEGESETEDTVAVDENKDPHPEPVLRTECLYHVSCCVEPLPEEPMEIQEEKEVVSGDHGKFLFTVFEGVEFRRFCVYIYRQFLNVQRASAVCGNALFKPRDFDARFWSKRKGPVFSLGDNSLIKLIDSL